jgi:HEAT repeat protein
MLQRCVGGGLSFIAIMAVVLTSALIPIVSAQTQPSADNDKIDYYYAKHDWKNLIKMGKPAIPRLIAALGDADPTVRYYVIFYANFAEKKDLKALSPLIDVLVPLMNNDESPFIRREAAQLLDKLHYSPGAESKMRFLLGSASVTTLRYAGAGLGFSPSDLEKGYPGHDFAEEAAASKLVAMGEKNTETLCSILKDLKSKGSLNEAVFAARILGVWRNKAAEETLIQLSDCSDRIDSGFTNVAPRCPLTSLCVVALGKIGDPTTVDHIVSLLKRKGPLPDVILASAIALERLNDKRAIQTLGELLHRDDVQHWEYEDKWSDKVKKLLLKAGAK